MDIRLIDTATSEVLDATRIEATATDVDVGGVAAAWLGYGGLIGGLSQFENTPMEEAIRTALDEAVKYVVAHTPRRYFQDVVVSETETPAASKATPGDVPKFSPEEIPDQSVEQVEHIRVITGAADICLRPDPESAVVLTVGIGTVLEVTAKEADWYRVLLPPDEQGLRRAGYIPAELVEVVETAADAG